MREPVLINTSPIEGEEDWKSFVKDFPTDQPITRLDGSVCIVTHYTNKGRKHASWVIQAWGYYVRRT
jgi:hypothetical protein